MRREYMYREFEEDKSLDQSNYMTVVALVDGFTFYVSRFALGDIQYKISGNDNWEDLNPLEYIPMLYKYQYVQFRGRTISCKFVINDDCKLTGDYSSMWRWSGSDDPDNEFIEHEAPAGVAPTALHAVFEDCVGIKGVSKDFLRHKENLPIGCYAGLFMGCENLTTAPELPATELPGGCYRRTFYGCTSLVYPPSELPATVLSTECYSSMFEGCTSLKSIPKIKAESIKEYEYIDHNGEPYTEHGRYCCRAMFKNCISLEEIPSDHDLVFSADHDYYWNFENMFRDCTGLKRVSKTFLTNGIPDIIDEDAISACGPRKLYGMFRGCTSLIEAPELTKPGYQYYSADYSYMFYGCKNLKKAPRIKVSYGYGSGFNYMFGECESLEIPPIIDCKNISSWAFSGMFYGCKKLKISPMIHCLHGANSWNNSSGLFENTFNGCEALESTYQVLPLTKELGYRIYNSMYKGCKSLTNAPILPAINLPSYGHYMDMFNGCSKINSVRSYHINDIGVHPDENTEACSTQNWLDGVSETGIFYKNKDAKWSQNNVPAGWSIEEETPKSLVRITYNNSNFHWDDGNTNEINSDLTITIMYYKPENIGDMAESMDQMKTDTVVIPKGSNGCTYSVGDKIIYNMTINPLVDEENIYYITSAPLPN